MLFDSYSIIVEFINESSIDTMYDFINYIKDILNHKHISFVTSCMISIDDIDTMYEANTVINKLKNLYLPDFKINGYRSFRISHVVCKEVVVNSNEWEVVTNEALKDKITTLEADNDILRTDGKKLKTIIKNNSDYISELEEKIKHLESRNKDLIKLCDEEYDKNHENLNYISELEDKVKGLEAASEKLLIQDRVRNGIISLKSELNTKTENQRKQIYYLEKKIERQRKVISEQETIISEKNSQLANANRKIDELIEGIRTPEDKTWKDKYDSLVISTNEVAKECSMWKNQARKYKKMVNESYSKACCEQCEKANDLDYIEERCHKAEIALSKIDDILKDGNYRKR